MSKKILIIVAITIAFTTSVFIIKQNLALDSEIQLKTIDKANEISPTKTPIVTEATISASTSSLFRLPKDSYTIALYGDSMIDTMGEKLEILQKELYRSYPKTTFNLYNYGIGAQNIETGVARFENSFSNKERVYPPITTIKADVIILGTFAYNPFVPHDLERYRKNLLSLIQEAKDVTLQVYLLIEIAPKKTGFGQGEYGVNLPEDQAYQQALLIIEQLKTATALANEQGVPIINAYKGSLIDDSFGNPIYVKKEDGIHPSFEGHVLMARAIISSLKFR